MLKKRLERKVLCISLGALDNAQTFFGLEENNEDKIQVCEKVYAHRTSSGVDFICRDEMFRYRMELEMMYGRTRWDEVFADLIKSKYMSILLLTVEEGVMV